MELVKKVQEELNKSIENYRSTLDFYFNECESPIEQLMAMNLGELELYFRGNIETIAVIPQEEITIGENKYRVDFLFELSFFYSDKYKKFLLLVIECDGYDFHQKTKEQVAKDYKRDRNLQANGYEILRFSGSEIFNNRENSKIEIKNFILRKYKEFYSKCVEFETEVRNYGN